MNSRLSLILALAASVVFSLLLPVVLACVRISGVTGDWKVIEPGSVLNLGEVGKGSVLYFYVDVRERNGCPPWDNWDRMWAKRLPPGIIQNYTGWFEIYFHPYTLIVTPSAKDGSYIVPLCVQDQGTGKIECFNLRLTVTEPRSELNYTISRDFNTLIVSLKNLGNVWQVCNVSTNLPAIISRKSFYLPADGYTGNLYIYPKEEGLLKIYVNCTASNLTITYNYKRMLVDVSPRKVEIYPGGETYVLLRKLPGADLNVVASGGISVILDYPRLKIVVPKNAQPGNYSINITATLGSRTQTIPVLVEVKSNWPLVCPFINVFIFNRTVSVEGLRPVTIPVMFWNQDSQDHDVPVSIEASSNLLVVKFPEKVHLPANKKIYYNLTVASLDYGSYKVTLKIAPCKIEKTVNVIFRKPEPRQVIYPLAEIKDPILELIPSEISIYPHATSRVNVTYKVINPNSNIVCRCNLNGKSFVLTREYSDVLEINVSSFFLAGTYKYPVNLYCNCGNKTAVVEQELVIRVLPYHQLEVRPKKILLSRSSGTFELEIYNKGNVPEKISIGSTCSKALHPSVSSLELGPGLGRRILVSYNFTGYSRTTCAILITGNFGQRIIPVSVKLPSKSHVTSRSEENLAPGLGLPVYVPFVYLLKFI